MKIEDFEKFGNPEREINKQTYSSAASEDPIHDFLTKHNVEIIRSKEYNGRPLHLIRDCVFDPSHGRNAEVSVHYGPNGEWCYQCKHDSCQDKHWHDFREHFEPGYQEKKQASDTFPYVIYDGCFAMSAEKKKQSGDDNVPSKLCNFVLHINCSINKDYDTGDLTRELEIEGQLSTGKKLPAVRIPVSDFSNMSFALEKWDHVQVNPKANIHVSAATLKFSPDYPARQVYGHTGLRKIDGVWRFLMPNQEGGIEVQLDRECAELQRYEFPSKVDDRIQAMRTSLKLLEIAPLNITVPLYAAMFRSVFLSIWNAYFGLFIEGQTDSKKSTLAGLFLSHFGKFDTFHLPASWNSTANYLERVGFLLKDLPLVIDEYKGNMKELQRKADQLFRDAGNNSSRGRMKSDTTLRQNYPLRSLIISTGEYHPEGESLLARSPIILMKPDDVDMKKLSEAQDQAHRLPHAMKSFVFDFLLPKREVLADELPKIWKNKRDEATVKNRHSRIAETIAHLQVAMDLALAHAKDIGAIDENKREYLSKECWQNLLTLGSDHSQLVTTEKPVNQYFQALKTLFIQKRAYLYSKLTYVKGFQDVLDISPVPGDGKGNQSFLGWYDKDFLYLMPEAAYGEVVKFYASQSRVFPVPENRLRRDLKELGISVTNDDQLCAKVKIGNEQKRLLKLERAKITALIDEDMELEKYFKDTARWQAA